MQESSRKILSILHLHQLPHRANSFSMGNYLVDSVERSAIFVLGGEGVWRGGEDRDVGAVVDEDSVSGLVHSLEGLRGSQAT
jgi:hypothetical protein